MPGWSIMPPQVLDEGRAATPLIWSSTTSLHPQHIPRGFETLVTGQPSDSQLREFHRCYGYPGTETDFHFRLSTLIERCGIDGDVISDVRLCFLSYTYSGSRPSHVIPQNLQVAFTHQLASRQVPITFRRVPGPEGVPWPTFRARVLELNYCLTAAIQSISSAESRGADARVSNRTQPVRQRQLQREASRSRSPPGASAVTARRGGARDAGSNRERERSIASRGPAPALARQGANEPGEVVRGDGRHQREE